MATESESLIRHELRSPRAAAIAGIVYALLIITVMLLSRRAGNLLPEEITEELLATWSGTFSLVIIMVPFAGIAFLWFTGVIRDRLREREDRFFATIFFGSGIIQVLLLFIWGAILGTIMRINAMTTIGVVENISSDIYIFAIVLMNEIIGNYNLRMASIFMTAIAALWSRTGVMPRWLILVTYLLAAGFLVAAERIREARFIFPLWVLLVSVYVLIQDFRHTHDQGIEDRVALDT